MSTAGLNSTKGLVGSDSKEDKNNALGVFQKGDKVVQLTQEAGKYLGDAASTLANLAKNPKAPAGKAEFFQKGVDALTAAGIIIGDIMDNPLYQKLTDDSQNDVLGIEGIAPHNTPASTLGGSSGH